MFIEYSLIESFGAMLRVVEVENEVRWDGMSLGRVGSYCRCL